MQPAPQIDPSKIIHTLERRQLDGLTAPNTPIWGAKVEKIPFLRVREQARFWEDEQNKDAGYDQYMEDLITGFHGQPIIFAYLVLCDKNEVGLYLAIKGGEAETQLASALRGAFPAVQLSDQPYLNLGTQREKSGVFNNLGRLTGVPTRKSGAQLKGSSAAAPRAEGRLREEGRVQQIERLLRGLNNEEWGYLVWATPISETEAAQASANFLSQLSEVSKRIKSQANIQKQVSQQNSYGQSESSSTSQTVDSTDHWAQYATELLERNFGRYKLGKAQGMWQTEVYFFAAKRGVLDRARSLLKAIFAGEDSSPESIRTFVGAGQGAANDLFATTLTSGEVATLCQLPREEFPGYRVTDYARFDVDLAVTPPLDPVAIGKVLDGAHPTGGWFSLERADFAKHGLIVGVTGSGKTNTVFHLMDKLWNKGGGIPFLVIEPAKTEYRDLLHRDSFKSALRVYTLGDESIAPFRLNPFEFEIMSKEHRIHVQTHIDFLKSVFNAAFILYAPMPYVLETCLHEIYEDKGWDLTTSRNRRVPPQVAKESDLPIFPTLTDLHNKIDEVVNRLGYEERIERDVKAGLKARIGSLRLGGKGLMLDTRHGIPMKELLSHPTILELERVGNDDEKAFLIGLILTRMYEFRIVQAKTSAVLPSIQHLTIFEEAHRLLKNVKTEVGTEESNTKGQAVETFSNMLSEIRAYGQGVLIAEQIPTKLAPDAIKNTNLKIMHRVVAADDREVMGGTMNMDEAQLRIVTALRSGQAVVYAEGADRPYLIQVVKQQEKDQKTRQRVTDAKVNERMKPITSGAIYDPVPGYSKHLNLPPEQQTTARDLALDVLAHKDFEEVFARYFLSLVFEPGQAVWGFRFLLKLMEREAGDVSEAELRQISIAVILHAAYHLFEAQGRRYRWFYNVAATLRGQLAEALVKIAKDYKNDQAALKQLTAQTTKEIELFIKGYTDQTRQTGPFAGCDFCQAQCLYRWQVATLVTNKTLRNEFTKAIQNTKDDQVMWAQLARNAQHAAERLLTTGDKAGQEAVAICYAAQMSAQIDFATTTQKKLVKNVQTVLAKPTATPKK